MNEKTASPYSNLVVTPKDFAEKSSDLAAEIALLDADFSRRFTYQRLGLHYIELLPHSRSSLPHAESLEEEFVYVISGFPHAWINGYMYKLRPGVALGFPAGTGLSHNLINNTDQQVQLLVFGDRTKKENLCAFPLNPEQERTSKIWWADAPTQILGSHNGQPGPVSDDELGPVWPPCLVDCFQLQRNTGFHYPGDDETFSHYVRLTDSLHLKSLGIGFESLEPGKRSAFPHAHRVEEEFAFVLSGTATVWLNGFVHQVTAGQAVAFLPNTNASHVLINDTDETLLYIVVGEAKDFEPDHIIYPKHPLRNEECKRLGAFWEDRPPATMGPHDGRPAGGLRDHMSFRTYTKADEASLLEVFQRSPKYFENVDGVIPSLELVRATVQQQPKKPTPDHIKEFLFIDLNDQPIGVAELHFNQPETGICYIGLLLLVEDVQAKGWGRRSYNLIENYAKRAFHCHTLRLGVSQDQNQDGFWKKMGFTANGKTYEWQGAQKTNHVHEFDKKL